MQFKSKNNHTIFNIAIAMTDLLYLLFSDTEKPKSLNIYVITYIYMPFELLMMKVMKTLSYM